MSEEAESPTDCCKPHLVSIVMPVHNAEQWLQDAFQSIDRQTWKESLEISIFNDSSKDRSEEIVTKWKEKFELDSVRVVVGKNESASPLGVGAAKNSAIKQSSGQYLCFFDADDIMLPKRIELQLKAAISLSWNTIIGCHFNRIPEDSTSRYTEWHNNLTPEQLYTQIYTSFGPTLIQPTWFCTRRLIETLGYFDEIKKGHPEDLTFFYKHLQNNGSVYRVNDTLLTYRYHENAASFSVHENTIWDVRLKSLEERVLHKLDKFTIWNAGKQGRKFYRSLSSFDRKKVVAMCDVDEKKIAKGVYRCELLKNCESVPEVPIIHFRDAKPPLIICVKINLTKGEFEKNLASLQLEEGKDYFLFS
eukprot:Seg737.4 transcript_id=Seg737.4/GoldUCD/mRNA.D3Y31 product="UDP-GlcNAc:betaGal beta-1 3-N-acetylglucosaminyltransferase-like protein 1" protein_id=Seg737.4/GoldUCD/D3Y31